MPGPKSSPARRALSCHPPEERLRRWCDAALAMKPTPEQMDRAVAALVPYVGAWGLSLNPEELHELAGAVLTHFDSDASFDAIDAAERARIQEFAREQAEIRRAFRTPTG
jgi:hypothetical protein